MSGVLSSAGLAAYKLAFEISPIILTGGIAGNSPASMLPIIVFTESLSFASGVLGGDVPDLDNFLCHFHPMPGGTMIKQTLGKYPFANQAVAANATIAQPLNISMRMECPPRFGVGGPTVALATFMLLKNKLAAHNNSGGTYTVLTPSCIYTNCILLDMVDASAGVQPLPQTAWVFNFEQPLITLAQAQAAQNTFTSKVTAGVPTDGSLSGATVAPSPLAGGAPTQAPGASGLPSSPGIVTDAGVSATGQQVSAA